ncbi:MAG: hypothetical protein AB1714_30950 [Acidobacteriota bacterium]
MIKKTLIIVGPGGVGKGPLADLIRNDAVSIDPYRLRPEGPRRESDDPLYAHPKLRRELHSVLTTLGDSCRQIPCAPEKMEWFPTARVLFFTVRGVWQCLILHNLDADVAKAELYAPVLPAMLGIAEIKDAVGVPHVLVLNPSSTPLAEMFDWKDLEKKTEQNCAQRGDSPKSVQQRVGTIPTEAPAWRTLVVHQGAIELTGWPFPEHRFKTEDRSMLLREAKDFTLRHAPELRDFFKDDDELRTGM